jgi:carbonic anhydrase/acetyltransferase-like protein (isoleucine patch superfamily)
MKDRPKGVSRRRPRLESLERRELLSTTRFAMDASAPADRRRVAAEVGALSRPHPSVPANHPVTEAVDSPSTATFIDPTAVIHNARATTIGDQVYIGPFATVSARRGAAISIGNSSNVQDNVEVRSAGRPGGVVIGDHVILAHNASVIGPATIGAPGGAAAFVGFNAVIDAATVQPGAMVSGLAKVAPGIVIPTGMKVKPGMYITTQAEAEQTSLGKVDVVTSRDIQFMNDVIHVNETLAAGYSTQAIESPSSVRGIGPNPPAPPFNPISHTPTLAGTPTTAPRFRNRIIGDVRMTNLPAQLHGVMGHGDSIRADEASPFLVGSIARMSNRVTVHGLENSNLTLGHRDAFGYHSLIHGGSDSGQNPEETTVVGDRVRIGAWAVVFKSTIGDRCTIGPHAYIEGSTLEPGTVVPRRAIIVNNQYLGRVQWV